MSASESRSYPLAFLAGAGVVLLLLGAFFLLGRGSRTPSQVAIPALPFGEAERAYAAQIRISDLQMSRAANLLNQEVTFLVGKVENSGGRKVRQIEVTVDYHDLINQLVLREKQSLLARGAPLYPAEKREFQLNFENVPHSWNQKFPDIRITGLQLE
jgi:hypothetical protein